VRLSAAGTGRRPEEAGRIHTTAYARLTILYNYLKLP
jgi:hypothetical protein